MIRYVKLWILTAAFIWSLMPPAFAGNKLRVVTTTATLASLVSEVAGDKAEVFSVASPRQNLHHVMPTPKDILKVKKADLLISLGMDAEPWLVPLIHAAGNPAFLSGTEKLIDASNGIQVLEVPAILTRLEGDIHPLGNPHYWLDPVNAKQMARNVVSALAAEDPEHAGEYETRGKKFASKLESCVTDWENRMKPFAGQKIVTYHRTWPYFAERFHLQVLDQLEPKPGIPPTAKHLAELMERMKRGKAALILKESYQESRTPQKVARETGAVVAEMLQSVGENKEASDYIAMMEYNVRQLEQAFRKRG